MSSHAVPLLSCQPSSGRGGEALTSRACRGSKRARRLPQGPVGPHDQCLARLVLLWFAPVRAFLLWAGAAIGAVGGAELAASLACGDGVRDDRLLGRCGAHARPAKTGHVVVMRVTGGSVMPAGCDFAADTALGSDSRYALGALLGVPGPRVAGRAHVGGEQAGQCRAGGGGGPGGLGNQHTANVPHGQDAGQGDGRRFPDSVARTR